MCIRDSTISAGVADVNSLSDKRNELELISAADLKLYEAKMVAVIVSAVNGAFGMIEQ